MFHRRSRFLIPSAHRTTDRTEILRDLSHRRRLLTCISAATYCCTSPASSFLTQCSNLSQEVTTDLAPLREAPTIVRVTPAWYHGCRSNIGLPVPES